MSLLKTQAAPRFAARAAAESRGELYLYDVIGEGWFGGISSKSVADALEKFKARGATEVCVYINSPGGDAFEGIAILNVLRRFDGKKTICVDGLAASAASIIAMAGDEIVMGQGAMMMVHDPWNIVMGSAPDLRKEADNLDKLRDALRDVYCARTGIDAKKCEQMMADETWMTAAEAVAAGFATSVSTDDEQDPDGDEDGQARASIDRVLSRYRKTPKNLRAGRRLPVAAAAGPMPAHPSKEPENMHAIAAVLALAATATEEQILTAINALKAAASKASDDAKAAADQLAKFVGLSGADSPATALGAMTAWKQSHEALPGVRAELAAIREAAAKAELEQVIKDGKDSGRITPALEPWARDLGGKDLAQLKGYLAAVQPAPKPVTPPAKAPTDSPDAAGSTLTPVERDILTKRGLNLEEAAKAKAKLVAEGAWPFAA